MVIELEDGDWITYDMREYECGIIECRYNRDYDGPMTIDTESTNKVKILEIRRKDKIIYEKK